MTERSPALGQIARDLLIEGLDDYVGLWEVAKLVRESHDRSGDPRGVRARSLRIVESLLAPGLVEAGRLTEGGGFAPWPLEAPDALARIEREWEALGRDPNIADVCWFSNTPAGDRIAEGLRGFRRVDVDGTEVIVFGDPAAPQPGNVDVEVVESDGSRWSATFFTSASIEMLFQKNAATGECANGLYLWAVDMIIVRRLSEAVILETIAALKASGEFESAFGRLGVDGES